ncbi:MAG: response regulator, partial [Thermoplasmata archaeon]|nr:response regulator [Thermoplasmata archaeon]
MTKKILFIDDDPDILAAYKSRLEDEFNFDIALGPEKGLEALYTRGPFAVVLADMYMPGMNGIQFLSTVKEGNPDIVRMMLTGNADLETASNAVNEGHIFRFLTKSCSTDMLIKSLEAGIKQYRLVTAEKELLEKTLGGSIKVLTEVLGLVNPEAFSRASRVRRCVKYIAQQLKLPELWQFELAAMLSQIGCVTIPAEILSKASMGETLSDAEEKLFSSHPQIAERLLANIPRLERIASIIKGQREPFSAHNEEEQLSKQRMTTVGSELLKIALDFDELISRGLSHESAITALRKREGEYNPNMITTLEKYEIDEIEQRGHIENVGIADLKIGMIIDEDVLSNSGAPVLRKGQEVTSLLIERLHNFAEGVGIREPFRIR